MSLAKAAEDLLLATLPHCEYCGDRDRMCGPCEQLDNAQAAVQAALDALPELRWIDHGLGHASGAVGRWRLAAYSTGRWSLHRQTTLLDQGLKDGTVETAKNEAEDALLSNGVAFRKAAK